MNNSQNTKPNLLDGRQVPGYWIFRGDTREFMLDENCAASFGINKINVWITQEEILEHITLRNMERFFRVMDTHDLGSIIFEDVLITRGPNAGKAYVINGSVLARFSDGKVRHATGYMVNAQSTFSEFIAREIAGDDFFSWDFETNRFRFSANYCHLLGYDEQEFPQTWEQWANIVHPDDRDMMAVERHIMESPRYGDSFEFCLRLRHYDGHYIWTIGRGIVLARNEQGYALSLIGSFSDINLVQDNFDNIKQMLYTDTLTGLKNRSYFQNNSAKWQDEKVKPIGVIYADVTGLKITNDVLGHADGDILLLTVTEALTTVITRPCDIMRLAGDEFVVIMTNCDEQECKALMQELIDYIDRHNSSQNVMPTFVGFGCAWLGELEQDTLHATIERADVRMQAYKDAHRKENYAQLKVYLEKRKGRPVSMRDGRRLEYYSQQEREQMHKSSQETVEKEVEVSPTSALEQAQALKFNPSQLPDYNKELSAAQAQAIAKTNSATEAKTSPDPATVVTHSAKDAASVFSAALSPAQANGPSQAPEQLPAQEQAQAQAQAQAQEPENSASSNSEQEVNTNSLSALSIDINNVFKKPY